MGDRTVTRLGIDAAPRHLTEQELAAYLDGAMAPADRQQIEAHLDACAECRGELVAGRRMLDALPRSSGAAGRIRRTSRVWIPAAMAASLAAWVLVPRLLQSPVVPAAAVRSPVASGEGRLRISIVEPLEGTTVDPRSVKFMWHAAAADLYRFHLLTESGEPIWSTETSDTSVSLPPSVVLQKGRSYFWRIDGIANGISATTGAHYLSVGP